MKRSILAIALAIALTTMIHGPVRADLATALAAYEAKDYAGALTEFQQLGRAGNAEAQFRLGLMHERGEGVAANDTVSWSWYKRAADANHVAAQVKVAESFEQARGVPMSLAEAYNWYKRAAERGETRAKTKVGVMNLYGQGKKPNYLEGVRWLTDAARAGDPDAQAVLDDLAAQGFEAGAQEGDADPKDPRARRVLEEVRSLLAPLREESTFGWRLSTTGKLRVASKGNDHVVVVPRVRLESGQATVRLGTIRLTFVADGEDTYTVKAQLPTRSAVYVEGRGEVASLSIASQTFVGRWSTKWHALLDYDAAYGGLRMNLAGGQMEVILDRLTARRSLEERRGKQDLADTLDIRGLRLQGGAAGRSGTATLANLAIRNEVRGLDLEGATRLGPQIGFDWRTGTIDGAKLAGLLKTGGAIPAMVESLSSRVAVDGGRVSGPDGRPIGELRHGEFRVAAEGLSGPLSQLRAAYSWDGLTTGDAGPTKGILPAAGVLAVGVDRFPTQDLLRAVLGMFTESDALAGKVKPGGADLRRLDAVASNKLDRTWDAFGATLAAARTEVRVEEISLAAEDFDVSVKGEFKALKAGWVGDLDVRVRDLDRLIAAAEGPLEGGFPVVPMAAGGIAGQLAAIKEYGREQVDAQGRKVTRFAVRFEPSGQILVNGRAISKQAGSRTGG